MITIEGLCEQLRRYNEFHKTNCSVVVNADTSCQLISMEGKLVAGRVTGEVFGNPYQLMSYLNENTGVRK